MLIRALAKWAVVALGLVLLVGCAEEKLTFERWQTIHQGQSPEARVCCRPYSILPLSVLSAPPW